MQLLLSGIAGVAAAFVSSFELYMTLNFALAAANAGFLLSANVLREYLGPGAFPLRVRAPKLPVGMVSGNCIEKGPNKILCAGTNHIADMLTFGKPFHPDSALVFTVSEWVGPSRRTQAMVLAQIHFSIGLMVLTGVAYGVRNWRLLQIIGTAPALLLVFYFW